MNLEGPLPRLWHGLRIASAPERQPPFPVDALVVEDDRWQALGADPEYRPAAEHPIRLMKALYEAEPLAPGTVVIHPGVPTRLHAVIHDLDCDPTWRPEWIAAALERAFGIAMERGYRALGLPLLGTRHGRLQRRHSLRLLDEALARRAASPLRRLWLID